MSDLENSKIVVTGGAGFIGSNLVGALVDIAGEVIVIDDLSTGRKENLAEYEEQIRFIEGSITDLDLLQKVFDDVDIIFHQAAIPSVPRSVEHPLKTNEANITGTLNVFVAARDNDVNRVVYACSSSTYGDEVSLPASEDSPLKPLSPYAVQKAAKEMYGKVFFDIYGLETVGLKYFNVFGPKQDPDSPYAAVIPIFVTQMLEGKQPTIFGDGETSRDFTYIDNVVHANIQAAAAKGAGGEVCNVATGNPITLNQLTQDINEILDTDIDPKYEDFRPGDIPHSHADISKAQRVLGYEVQTQFRAGLAKTIQHLK